MKPVHREFLIAIANKGCITVREIVDDFVAQGKYQHPKQAIRKLEQWCDKGWYEYGVSVDLGWLTPEGMKEAQK